VRTALSLSSWKLDRNWDPLRQPARDPALRQPDFEDRYDFQTVFYDLFWAEDGQTIIAVAPPLMNLESELDLQFRALPSGDRCAFRIDRRVLIDRITITPPPGTVALVVESSAGCIWLAPQPNLATAFSGLRALFTLSKDNHLAWIRDWALFYVRNHGCNAVVVYDNGSTRYTPTALAEVLASVPGLERVLVVDWRFPYGAFDLRQSPALNRIDAVHCQWGCFEHARLRLFPAAASVSNADIDELVVSDTGESVFEAAERSPVGYIAYRGFWIECPPEDMTTEVARAPRHRHFCKTTPQREGCPSKWTVAPGRTPSDVQWGVHEVWGIADDLSHSFEFRHLKPINTDWDFDRPAEAQLRTEGALNPEATIEDGVFKAALARAFPDGERLVLPQPRGSASAYAMRLQAGTLARAGRLEAALQAAEQACSLSPEHPNFAFFLSQMLRRLGHDEQAAAAEQKAQSLHHHSPHHFFQAGYECFCLGRHDEGAALVMRAVEMDPTITDHAVYLIRQLLMRGDLRGARAAATLADAHCPPESRQHLDIELVTLLLREGAVEEASEIARRAVDRAPDDLAALMALFQTLRALRRFDAALELLDRALVLAAARGGGDR
jgi:Flp pilus assembly protein TadD